MHPHRSSALRGLSLCLRHFSTVHTAGRAVRGACTAKAAAPEALGLSVGGCVLCIRGFAPVCLGRTPRTLG